MRNELSLNTAAVAPLPLVFILFFYFFSVQMTLTTSLSRTPLLYWTKRCTFAKGNYRSSGGSYRQIEDKGSRNRRNYKTEGHCSRFIHDPREMALVGKSTAPLRGDGLSHGGSEMDENQAPADVTLQDSKVRPKNPTFRRRVEDAAATLRSGKSTQQRRRISTNAADFHTMHVKGPTEVSQQTTRQSSTTAASLRSSKRGSEASPRSSLLSSPESNDQMAASQRRLFEQMVTLRTRLNERLAASNKFAKYLESTLKTRDKDIKHANERLVAAMLEIESLKHIATEAVEAVEDEEMSRTQIAGRLDTLTKRLDLMHAALRRDVQDIDAACIKSVPIRWVGMASDIRIMGSFDHWTKGVAMSPEFIEGGNNVFVADLMLVSGTYEIKFVVDGIWQTAPEWATTGDGLGANNLLVVE